MKNYINPNCVSLIVVVISLISLIISLITLFLMIKPDISNYLHRKEIEQRNRKNYISALKYYDTLSTEIKNHNLNKPFSNLKSSQCLYELSSTCYYIVTDDVKNDRFLVDLSCVKIATDICTQLDSCDNELKRTEILKELDKLKYRVRALIKE